MANFNYNVRILTGAEYDHLMGITAEDNSIIHWVDMFSWIDDPKPVAKHPNLRPHCGYNSARYYDYYSADHRDKCVGFRPAFDSPSNDTLSAVTAEGDVVVIGTLYMNGKPVRIPQYPTYDGDIPDYIPGAKLEFRSALNDPAYQVRVIKCSGIFICDRCLLKNISYEDITTNLSNESAQDTGRNQIKHKWDADPLLRVCCNQFKQLANDLADIKKDNIVTVSSSTIEELKYAIKELVSTIHSLSGFSK